MNIGILTFHCAHNYGAVLQAYALQEFLKMQGYNVHIIDYRPSFLLKPYNVIEFSRFNSKNPIKNLAKFALELFLYKRRLNRWNSFNKFINNELNLLPLAKVAKVDAIVIGSDQVWNPKFNNAFDFTYLGKNENVFEYQHKLIAYAASASTLNFTSNQSLDLKKHLEKFSAISVREYSLKSFLDQLMEKEITIHHVLDPTLLVRRDCFEHLLEKQNRIIKEDYLLIYQVHKDKHTYRIAKQIASRKKLKIIEVASGIEYSLRRKIWTFNPIDFLNLFQYASFVVTTSFHGTAFSVIFNKPFYVLKFNTDLDMRVSSLLMKIGLEDRHILHNLPIDEISNINYTIPNNKLEELRKKSVSFLLGALKENID